MNNKILWGIIVVLIAVGGWYYYSQQSTPVSEQGMESTQMAGTPMRDDTAMADGDSMLATDASLQGTWISTEDTKFTRQFNPNGTVTDAYAGDASATETAPYAVNVDASTATGLSVPAANLAGTTLVRIDFKSGPMYFGIVKLTATDLQMTNLSGRGNILVFTKPASRQ